MSTLGVFLLQSNLFFMTRVSFSESRNSSFKLVGEEVSIEISVGKLVNSQEISTLFSFEWTLESEASILTVSLLKNTSRASNIVDLPISFLPIIVVNSSNTILVSDLYALKFLIVNDFRFICSFFI